MSAISLEKSVRTCDVNVGEASRIQSERFMNSSAMLCPLWNGVNSKGQAVCPDSFYTKTPGCDSAEDRVAIENILRPKYAQYVTLSAAGISGHIYGNTMTSANAKAYDNSQHSRTSGDGPFSGAGNFGLQAGANTRCTDCTKGKSCSVNSYERAMAQMARSQRGSVAAENAYMSHRYAMNSGNH